MQVRMLLAVAAAASLTGCVAPWSGTADETDDPFRQAAPPALAPGTRLVYEREVQLGEGAPFVRAGYAIEHAFLHHHTKDVPSVQLWHRTNVASATETPDPDGILFATRGTDRMPIMFHFGMYECRDAGSCFDDAGFQEGISTAPEMPALLETGASWGPQDALERQYSGRVMGFDRLERQGAERTVVDLEMIRSSYQEGWQAGWRNETEYVRVDVETGWPWERRIFRARTIDSTQEAPPARSYQVVPVQEGHTGDWTERLRLVDVGHQEPWSDPASFGRWLAQRYAPLYPHLELRREGPSAPVEAGSEVTLSLCLARRDGACNPYLTTFGDTLRMRAEQGDEAWTSQDDRLSIAPPLPGVVTVTGQILAPQDVVLASVQAQVPIWQVQHETMECVVGDLFLSTCSHAFATGQDVDWIEVSLFQPGAVRGGLLTIDLPDGTQKSIDGSGEPLIVRLVDVADQRGDWAVVWEPDLARDAPDLRIEVRPKV